MVVLLVFLLQFHRDVWVQERFLLAEWLSRRDADNNRRRFVPEQRDSLVATAD